MSERAAPTDVTLDAVSALGDALRHRGWHLATAESCTGGLIAGACTAAPGSSDWFAGGVVTYSNALKSALLGVDAVLIASHGAVSAEVAEAMAQGAVERLAVDLAVAATGIAGPGGAVPGKPVGTVWLGVALRGAAGVVAVRARRLQLDGDRDAVRKASVAHALAWLSETVREGAVR